MASGGSGDSSSLGVSDAALPDEGLRLFFSESVMSTSGELEFDGPLGFISLKKNLCPLLPKGGSPAAPAPETSEAIYRKGEDRGPLLPLAWFLSACCQAPSSAPCSLLPRGSWLLNDTGLNCTGPLVHGFFFFTSVNMLQGSKMH